MDSSKPSLAREVVGLVVARIFDTAISILRVTAGVLLSSLGLPVEQPVR
jgi:hypothetical protein